MQHTRVSGPASTPSDAHAPSNVTEPMCYTVRSPSHPGSMPATFRAGCLLLPIWPPRQMLQRSTHASTQETTTTVGKLSHPTFHIMMEQCTCNPGEPLLDMDSRSKPTKQKEFTPSPTQIAPNLGDPNVQTPQTTAHRCCLSTALAYSPHLCLRHCACISSLRSCVALALLAPTSLVTSSRSMQTKLTEA
jgi:hypothetical protein